MQLSPHKIFSALVKKALFDYLVATSLKPPNIWNPATAVQVRLLTSPLDFMETTLELAVLKVLKLIYVLRSVEPQRHITWISHDVPVHGNSWHLECVGYLVAPKFPSPCCPTRQLRHCRLLTTPKIRTNTHGFWSPVVRRKTSKRTTKCVVS